MSLSAIRTKLKSELEAISGIEKVYDYKRFCSDLATYKDLFIKNDKVNTWEIERKSFERTGRGSPSVEDIIHVFIIRGFYSFYDKFATEKTFQDLVEDICNVFIADPTLDGVAKVIHVPITGEFSTAFLGAVLCHVVEIEIHIEERII